MMKLPSMEKLMEKANEFITKTSNLLTKLKDVYALSLINNEVLCHMESYEKQRDSILSSFELN